MPNKNPGNPGTGPGSGAPPGGPEPCPLEPEYHLHVDANRDGRVDDDYTGIDSWTWGVAGRGAIMIANCDDEDGTHNPDNEDNRINGAPDPEDIAPLEIRRVAGKPAAPGSWTAFLEVDPADARNVRIFESRAAGAAEVVGPTAGHSYQLPTLGFQTREFGMEGTRFPTTDPVAPFTGEVRITMRIVQPTGTQSESALVRVAPWVQFNHWDPTEMTYVVGTSYNADFRTDLSGAATAAGFPAPQVKTHTDPWMQDIMEIGFTTMPKTSAPDTWSLPVVLRTANDRVATSTDWGDIDKFPREDLLAQNYGFVQALPPTIGDSLDSMGNLECSPPFRHSVSLKEYKFGRIVYGMDALDPARDMRSQVREFLIAQTVQEPFSIDTGWLSVGHVDEVVSFCPMKNAAIGFKVLLASPDRALNILNTLESGGHGSARMFQGIRYDASYTLANRRADYPLSRVDRCLANAGFMVDQAIAQGHIDTIKSAIQSAMGLADSDFIHLPVLFTHVDADHYVAYTPGVVNMLVLTKTDHTVKVCVPKPFGPKVGGVDKFEEDVLALLGPAATTGVDVVFIDDFITYHVNMGEIHCGTNSKRKPRTDVRWWEHQP